ncbi:C25 family cysteine peptidase [Bacteroidota bacterium]
MKKLLIIIFVLFCNFTFSQNSFISFTNKSLGNPSTMPVRSIEDNGVRGIEIEYSFNGAIISNTIVNKTAYQFLHIEGYGKTSEVGRPALPTHNDLIAIPLGAEATIKIIDIEYRKANNFLIHPALQPAVDTEGAPEPQFEIDENFYKSNVTYPSSFINIIEIMKIRGMSVAVVQVNPVQYNPAKKQLTVYSKIKFKIEFSGGSQFVEEDLHSEHFLNNYSNYVLNSQGIKNAIEKKKTNSKGNKTDNGKNYIILTHSNYIAAADSLAEWKRKLGYSTEIVSASNWTASAVKSAIHTRYHAWTPKPDYFVIIGDHGDVPAEIYLSPPSTSAPQNFGTDLYYSCMDGGSDYVPDIAKGRISVSSPTQAMTVVQKMINYERNPVSDSTFYQNGVNCAQYQDDDNNSFADRRFLHTSEEIRDYILGRGYNIQRIYYTNNSVYPQYYNSSYYSNGQSLPSVLLKSNGFPWNGGASHITSSINAGKFYVLHRDHGYAGGSGWAHPYYVKNSINSLNNGEKLPVVFSINCHTGEFTLNECFAEKFHRKANSGAVGVFAASYFSMSGYNDALTIGMFDAIWSNPGLVANFGSGGIGNPSLNSHSDIYTMGDVLNQGLIRMVSTWGDYTHRVYQHRLFHYFGDPAMHMWTAKPNQITASHNDSINCNASSFSVINSSCLNAVATLVSNNTLIGKTQLVNGSGQIPLNGFQGTTAILTLSQHNHIPYSAEIVIVPGPLSVSNMSQNVRCRNGNDGEIDLIISCGNFPYTISWSNGDSTESINNLTAGTYVYTVTDNMNSSITDSVTITHPATFLTSSATQTDVKCYFGADGQIDLSVVGGLPPYSYKWSNLHSGQDLIGVGQGTYYVTITDSYGCQIKDTVTVNQPPLLIVSITHINDLYGNCSGEATATVSGGIPPYTYLWNDSLSQTTPIASGLCPGIYKVIATDSNNCTKYWNVLIENTSSINETKKNNSYTIYPNPSNDGTFMLSLNNIDKQQISLIVYNNIGECIVSEKLEISNNFTKLLQFTNSSQGIYFLRIELENGETIEDKLIVY